MKNVALATVAGLTATAAMAVATIAGPLAPASAVHADDPHDQRSPGHGLLRTG